MNWIVQKQERTIFPQVVEDLPLTKEAAPKLRSGSYADGIAGQSLCLPLAVVGPHVNLPSSDHSEVASDKNRFANCFLALCAKTLSEAKIELDFYFHIRNKFYYLLESWERLVKSTSSALSQNKRSICLCFGRRSVTSALESAQNFMKIKIHHKDKHFFRNCKFDHNQYRSHPNNLEWLLNVLNMNAR